MAKSSFECFPDNYKKDEKNELRKPLYCEPVKSPNMLHPAIRTTGRHHSAEVIRFNIESRFVEARSAQLKLKYYGQKALI